MNMYQRIVGVLLCFAILLSVATVTVSAKGEFVIRGSQVTARAGNQVTVDVLLENNPGICALNLYYLYDQTNLTLKTVESKVSAFTMTHDVTTVWDAASNYTQDGILATLIFEVAENAPNSDYEIQIYFISAANDEFEEVQATTASGTITVAQQGRTLEGKLISYGSATDEVTLEMFEASGDSVYRSIYEKGNSVSYSIPNVAYGTYTFRVSKNHHVTRTYIFSVYPDEATLDMKICLIGDVTGDGKVNIMDVAKLYAHVKGVGSLTDSYILACGNVTGDSKVNIMDIAKIYAHVKGQSHLY